MQYLISFLEGIITFISPCLLPMLPIYISYFAGGGERTTGKTLKNASGFVLGFTLVFVAMGALAGSLGSFLTRYQTWVNIIGGSIVILFGLNYMGLLKLNLFRGQELCALMILFAAPTAVSSYPMAVAMDADGDFAAQMVAYTTIFCLPTIFLWTLLLNSMGWM